MTLSHKQSERRYHELDWLRILAFGLLILYHTGMYYVLEWGWHIKSEHTYGWLQDAMILTNQWRMSLLFFISAFVTGLVIKQKSRWFIFRERSNRLLIPLLFGMAMIVAPQVYIEFTDRGMIAMSYPDFWLQYLNVNTTLLPEKQSVIGLVTWNHLWFLPYLFCYSVILLVLAAPLKWLGEKFNHVNHALIFLLLVVTMTVIWLALRRTYPVTHDLVTDWYSHGKYFLVCLFGFALAFADKIQQSIVAARIPYLMLAILGYGLLIAEKHGVFAAQMADFDTSITVRLVVGLIVTANHFAWILALYGFASRYLNRDSRLKQYLNKAILPYYMVHQTVIVMLAWWLRPYGLADGMEALVILAGVTASCYVTYEVARRVALLRWLFGLATARQREQQA